MCTALTITTKEGYSLFGRNMDLEYNFNQKVVLIPRNFLHENKATKEMITNKHAIIGMGTVIEGYPAMADGVNEKGLACAGLNFNGYAHYESELSKDKLNIPPYEFILWVLSNHETIEEIKEDIKNIELVDVPISPQYPIPTLHWIIVDKSGKSIVVEKTKDKFVVYDNRVSVMTNNPTFDWHLTNLNEYVNLSNNHSKDKSWGGQTLTAHGAGVGTRGIPGDFASVSRFVRIAYIRSVMPEVEINKDALAQFFNMLDYVKMVKGGVLTSDNLEDITLYTACMNQEKGIYYYRTYDNNRINAIDMHKHDLDAKELKEFKYLNEQDINDQNE